MRILAFSDLHRDLAAARSIVARAPAFDVVVGAGDFCSVRRGLPEVIDVLRDIRVPTVLVAGNAETPDELEEACKGWDAAHLLHGSGVDLQGVSFYGLGGAVPVTPFGAWSFDLSEEEAKDLLAACPHGAVLVSHSPPRGTADTDSSGRHLGSRAVVDVIEAKSPRLLVCGHIHASWGARAQVGSTEVVNAGPLGVELVVQPV